MAGARRRFRSRSFTPSSSASPERTRNSSRSNSRTHKSSSSSSSNGRRVQRRSRFVADAAGCVPGGPGGRERGSRSGSRSTSSRAKGRSSRAAAATAEDGRCAHAGERNKVGLRSHPASKGTSHAEDIGHASPLRPLGDHAAEEIKERRKKKHLQEQTEGGRRCPSRQSSGRYDRQYDDACYHREGRERGGGYSRSRFDHTSRTRHDNGSSTRYESSGIKYDNKESGSSRYNSSTKYTNRSSRSARDENSSATRHGYSSTGRGCYRGAESTIRREGVHRRYAGSDSSVYGEKCGSSSSRHVKSTSRHGMPPSSASGYGESYDSARCGDYSSSRYADSRAHETGRLRRVSPFPLGEGRREKREEERRNGRRTRQRSYCSRSGERDLSPARRTKAGRGRGAVAEGHEEAAAGGKRGRGGRARNDEAAAGAAGKGATADLRDGRTSAAAASESERRRSFEGEAEGPQKKQRHHAATIGSRASFLRSNAPAAPRFGSVSSVYGTERYKYETGIDVGLTGRRITERNEPRKQDVLQPPWGEKGNTQVIDNHVNAAKTTTEEERDKHSRSQQEGHHQRQQEQHLQQRSKGQRREHADATEGQQPQKSRGDTGLYGVPSPSATDAAVDEEREQQQQLKRGRSSPEDGAAQRRETDVETPIMGKRTCAGEEVSGRDGKERKEEQRKEGEKQQQEQHMKGGFVAKRGEGAGELEESRTLRRVLGEHEEQERVKTTNSKDEAAAAGRQHQERAGVRMQQQQQQQVDSLPQERREGAAAAIERGDEASAAAAAARAGGTHEGAARQDGEHPAGAGREEGVVGTIEKRGGGAAARREGPVESQEEIGTTGATTGGTQAAGEENEVAAKHRGGGGGAAAPGRGTEEEPVGAGGTDAAARKGYDGRAGGDSCHLAAPLHVANADEGRRDRSSTGGAPAKGAQEAKDRKVSAISSSPPLLRRTAVTADKGDNSSVAGGKVLSANETSTAAERLQVHEKAAVDMSGVVPADSARAAAAADVEAAEAAVGAAVPCGGAAGAEAAAAASQERGDKSQGEAAAGTLSGLLDGEEDAETRAVVEGVETTIMAETFSSRDPLVIERGRSTSSVRDSRVSDTAAVSAEEEEQRQQTGAEAGEESYASSSSSSTLQHSSQASWRVVTAEGNVRSPIKGRNRSGSGTSGCGEEGYPGEVGGTSRRRARDEAGRREKGGGEERRRVWCPTYGASGSPEPQKEVPLFKHPLHSYPVPYSSSCSSSLHHNYSPSRPYSPSRDLSPGPCAAASSVPFNRGDRHRTVLCHSAAYASAASFPRHPVAGSSELPAAAPPRTAVAVSPSFSPHGLGAAVDARGRRGEAAFMLIQEGSAAAVSLRRWCNAQTSAPAPHLTAVPLSGLRLPQQQQPHQQHQHGRKVNRNRFPGPAFLPSPLSRPGGRPPVEGAAFSKSGAAKDPRRKENSKWTHDLFEQVVREPEKSRRRFNLYSENLEIAE